MIKLVDIKREYHGRKIFDGVNITVNDGDVVGIIGPSGSGKSRLLKYILMLDKPDSGHIYLDENELIAGSPESSTYVQKIGMVFQTFNLFSHLSVIENVCSGMIHIMNMDPKEAMAKATDILRMLGLSEIAYEYPANISGGQKQRVAIARTIAMDPDIILFDEPTSSLDPSMSGEVCSVIRLLSAQKRTMLIVSHEMALIEDICNKVVFLNEGVNYEEGSPKEIFDHPKRAATRRFIKNLRLLAINVESKDFDFIGMQTTIDQFAFRNGISKDISNKLLSVMEELSQMIIITPKEENKLNASFEYNAKDKVLVGNIMFTGEKFDPDNPYYFVPWSIIQHRAKKLEIVEPSDKDYSNQFYIELN